MKKLFHRISRNPNPISLHEFQKRLSREFIIGFVFLALITYFTYFQKVEASFNLESAFIGLIQFLPLYFLIRLSRLYADRLSSFYQDGTSISHLAVAVLVFFPLTNIYLLYLCFKNKTGSYPAPEIVKRRWTMVSGFFIFLFLQSLFFWFIPGIPQAIHISRVINPPVVHYFNCVNAEARWAFLLKDELSEGKIRFIDEYKKFNEISDMTSTGHILGTAVMATDVFKRKKANSKSKTGSTDSALELAESSMFINSKLQEPSNLYYKFSPLSLFSPIEFSEAGILNFLEHQIRVKFDKEIVKKVSDIIAKIKENGIEKDILTADHHTRIKKLELQFHDHIAKEQGVRE